MRTHTHTRTYTICIYEYHEHMQLCIMCILYSSRKSALYVSCCNPFGF